MPPKKSNPANDSAPLTPFLTSIWGNLWGLADDTRAEAHKQATALISLVDGGLRGVTGYATNLNDRADRLTHEALVAADQSGRALAAAALETAAKLAAGSQRRATQLVVSTRDSARTVADRATATAQVIVAPTKPAKAVKKAA